MKIELENNVGAVDGYFRLLLGLVAIFLGILFSSWWGALGFIFVVTAAFKNCPLYSMFGLSTDSESSSS